MSEVLYLHYHAHLKSLFVRIDPIRTGVDPTGATVHVPLAGALPLEDHVSLPELAADSAEGAALVADLESILVRLEPLVRARTDNTARGVGLAPDKVRAEVNRLATERHAHAAARHALGLERAALEAAKAEIAKAGEGA